MALLASNTLTVHRGATRVLELAPLAFGPGELVLLIGPNGAGKSTYVRALAGLDPTASRAITLEGRALDRWSADALARRRAYLPQYGLAPMGLTVAQAIALGRPERADPTLIEAAAARLDVTHLLARAATQLSGGEGRRVALARVLTQLDPIHPGKLLLLDEPLAGLDFKHQLGLLNLLQALRQQGLCVLLCAHELQIALPFATRVVALEAGQLAFDLPAPAVSARALAGLFDVPEALFGSTLAGPTRVAAE